MIEKNILIVEDEKAIRDMIKFLFINSQFVLHESENVTEARECIFTKKPDLILLDWMLPGKNGVDFVKELRTDPATVDIPIIMLTAKSEESDRVQGLSAGADDYVVKPFSPKELTARINAVLRRSGHKEETLIRVADLIINDESHRVMCLEKQLFLGPLEYKLLHFFMTHADRVFSRSQLIDFVWGGNTYIEERTVDVHIRRLRKILSEVHYDKFIQTIRGSGYRFSVLE